MTDHFTIFVFKCYAVATGRGRLHALSYRLCETEPALFNSVVLDVFDIPIFLYFLPHQCYLCHVEAVKSRPIHIVKDVVFSIIDVCSARHYCCVNLTEILSFKTK
jgi:hypothetical protein